MKKYNTLLLACETMENRRYIRHILEADYSLLEASNIEQILVLLQQNKEGIAALVIDVSQSQMLDIELLNKPEYFQEMKRMPIIILAKEDTPELVHRGFELGASDVIPLNYEPFAMLRRIENIVDLHLHKQHLEQMVQEQANALWQSNETLVDALSSIIEYRNTESGQHIIRIRHFTRILLEEVTKSCPEYGLDERTIAIISSASVLHDIGKIAIPDRILIKGGRLTPKEREIMKTHSDIGCQILDTIKGGVDEDYLRYAYNICRYHHERWDGSGYPEGLSGEKIPICAQVVGLVDAYDALTNKQNHKEAYPFTRSVNMILHGECGAFSPKLLECFKHVAKELEETSRVYMDGANPKTENLDVNLPLPAATVENSVEHIQAKYMTLAHYINSMLVEVNLSQNQFHVVYNPYLDISWLKEIKSFSEFVSLLDEGNGRSKQKFRQQLLDFIEQDFRRNTCYICLNEKNKKDYFEVTLLRVAYTSASKDSLAILFRRLDDSSEERLPQEAELLANSSFLCRYDENFTLVQLSEHVPILAGYSRQELKTYLHDRLIELVLPEDREYMRNAFREQFQKSNFAEVQYRIRMKDGKVIWVMDRSMLSVGTDGKEYVNTLLTDITESKAEYENLKDKLRRYEIVLTQTENVLFDWDAKEDKIEFSETWNKLFKYPPAFQSARKIMRDGSYFHPDDFPLFTDKVARLKTNSDYEVVDVRISIAGGRYIWCRFRATAIRDVQGNLEKICGIIIKIDAEKRAEEHLQVQAERDGLTKLLNKKAARKRAEEYFSQSPDGTPCAMLIIDLDNFKYVNDHYGHLFGDTVLKQVSKEISKLFRDQDIVARIGGDEFMVLMRGINDRRILENRCLRLLNIFTGLFHNGDQKLPLGCSIGIALSPEHGVGYYDLFNKADQALYQVKNRGKNSFAFYEHHEGSFLHDKIGISAVNNPIDSDKELESMQENLVNTVLHRLHTSQNIEQSIQEILAMVGKKTNVSRVYVFENSEDNKFCKNTYEWCNEGITPEREQLQNISYETDIPGYAENFDEQGIFYCPDVSVLPSTTYEIVKAQNIKSMLQYAIRDKNEFRGYIGFDECVEQRMWTKEHIQVLSDFSEMLSVFLLKYREHERTLAVIEKLNHLLDSQNDIE